MDTSKVVRMQTSHPTRGGWIEIMADAESNGLQGSHPTRGGWIEISGGQTGAVRKAGPTPHGVGGLKYEAWHYGTDDVQSHPTRGGWIEIGTNPGAGTDQQVPPHTGWVD